MKNRFLKLGINAGTIASIFLIILSCSKTEEPSLPPAIDYLSVDTASIGQIINIEGKNFGSGNDLSIGFNGVTTKPLRVGFGSVTVIVPEGATSGKVSVNNNGLVGESPSELKIRNWHVPVALPSEISQSEVIDFFECNNKIYLVEGYLNSRLWEFDPSTKAFNLKSALPINNTNGVASFVLNGKIYIQFEASLNGYGRDFYEFNPSDVLWTKKADFPDTGAPIAKIGFAFGTRGYFILGTNPTETGGSKFFDVRVYDSTNGTWGRIGDFPGEHRWAVNIYTTDSNVIIGAGIGTTELKEQWKFDPEFGLWEQIEDLPGQGRHFPALFYLTNRLFYGLGENGSSMLKDFWQKDSNSAIWTPFDQFSDDYHSFIYGGGSVGKCASIGNKGYYLTGDGIMEFDPEIK